MSLRRQVKQEGSYPDKRANEVITRHKLNGSVKSILLTSYESDYSINIYMGGRERWCVHCELIKDKDGMKPTGFLIKIRYDMLCSLEKNIIRGEATMLLQLLIQYISIQHPTVKELSFNDLSTRQCDNATPVNLAVMTYLYTGKTWYQKNFHAYLSPQSEQEWERIKALSNPTIIPWEEMKQTIRNRIAGENIDAFYHNAHTWQDFFGPIFQKIGIAKFCIFVSEWIDHFIAKYFNNLMGLTFLLPIRNIGLHYSQESYQGGRRTRRKKYRHYTSE